MYNQNDVQILGILKIADLFGDEYVRNHRFSGCNAISYDFSDNEAHYFVGFEGNQEKNIWTEFAYVAVNKNNGNVRFLDYKLPSGRRMENPPHPVIYS